TRDVLHGCGGTSHVLHRRDVTRDVLHGCGGTSHVLHRRDVTRDVLHGCGGTSHVLHRRDVTRRDDNRDVVYHRGGVAGIRFANDRRGFVAPRRHPAGSNRHGTAYPDGSGSRDAPTHARIVARRHLGSTGRAGGVDDVNAPFALGGRRRWAAAIRGS